MPAAEVFDRSYIPEPNSGCWLWERGTTPKGYGSIQRRDYNGYAHRFSYLRFKGEIPDGMLVCHTCDNPYCVNPDHLWLGTHRDNSHDSLNKGRNAAVVSPETQPFGERHGLAVLTEEKVINIRKLYGQYTYDQLAEQFGCSPATICQVVRRVTWTHI